MAHISTIYGHLGGLAGPEFVVIGSCVGEMEGLRSVKISRKGRADLWGYAGSVEQAKRHVERWRGGTGGRWVGLSISRKLFTQECGFQGIA